MAKVIRLKNKLTAKRHHKEQTCPEFKEGRNLHAQEK